MASTSGVLPPGQNDGPWNENSPRRKGLYTTYEHSKQESEDLARKFVSRGLPVVIVNSTKAFGPGPVDQSNSATFMIREYLKGMWRVIPGKGQDMMDYVYVEDVAAGIRLAMVKGSAGEQYILGGEPVRHDMYFLINAWHTPST